MPTVSDVFVFHVLLSVLFVLLCIVKQSLLVRS